MAKNQRADVGYGRPPTEHQFKPGESGNPKGRPKGRLGMAGLLRKTINERVTIVEHGRKRTISKAEAAFKQITNKAASGDMRAMAMLFGLIQTWEGRTAEPTLPYSTESDHAVMAQMAKHFQKTLNTLDTEVAE